MDPIPAPLAPVEPTIGIEDFQKIVLKTAEVVAAEIHPNADRLLKLTLRVGEETRTVCAGIRTWWTPEELVGKTVVIVANLAPRVIRGVESRGMVLAVQDGPEGAVSPLSVSRPVRSGMRVT